MRLAITFGFNQVISHGFGVFLFAALVPMMQHTININSWYLALAGALTQISYLAGAMLLGVVGHRLDSGRTLLVTGSLTSSLLFIMGWLNDPIIMMCLLTIMAASAAMSWGSIVELVTRHGRADRTATNLSIASSGTAWGYSVNGLIILLIVPLLGWRSSWMVASVLGLVVVFTTFSLLKSMRNQAQSQDIDVNFAVAMGTKQLFKTVFRERTAFLSCLILLLVGASTITFTTWLNTYLAELSLPPALGGYTWSMIGLTGMIAGFFVGKLADKKGHGVTLLSIFGIFALGLVAFSFHPAHFVLLAGFGYGMMYFPIWGIVAGWVSKQYSSKATMQINGIGMVAFGLGGSLGNLLAGMIHEATGSLQNIYWLICALGIVLFILATYIFLQERQSKTPMVGDISPAA
ncbi:MFS transporter [Marinomonas spartinae]|uniref:MFS transporter n=1 Tax=Marinomonas spartinae TaxID=1792290 RepID=UPI0018F1E670|nr:MFS transporter [Marinomonas spartinae]MBJ7556536.1 MFS transporter [Marinomonas spartinae]